MGPASMSIMSAMRPASALLVATLITGQIGLPVGVPRPVVNKISVAPLAAWGWSGLHQRWRWGLLLLSPLLLAGGLHHVLYAPTWTCSIGG